MKGKHQHSHRDIDPLYTFDTIDSLPHKFEQGFQTREQSVTDDQCDMSKYIVAPFSVLDANVATPFSISASRVKSAGITTAFEVAFVDKISIRSFITASVRVLPSALRLFFRRYSVIATVAGRLWKFG
jgi:hypothetical protein